MADAPIAPKNSFFANVPAEVIQYVHDLEAKVDGQWASSHVVVIAIVAFIVGWFV